MERPTPDNSPSKVYGWLDEFAESVTLLDRPFEMDLLDSVVEVDEDEDDMDDDVDEDDDREDSDEEFEND